MAHIKDIAYFKVTRKRHGGKFGDIIVYNALKEDGRIVAVDPLRETIRHNSSFGSQGMKVEVSDKETFEKNYNKVINRR